MNFTQFPQNFPKFLDGFFKISWKFSRNSFQNLVFTDSFDFLQDEIVKEFREEIRKLKTMIVKHENRIRGLEARLADTESTLVNDKPRKDGVENHSSGDSSNNNICADKNANSSGDQDHLAPDEV